MSTELTHCYDCLYAGTDGDDLTEALAAADNLDGLAEDVLAGDAEACLSRLQRLLHNHLTQLSAELIAQPPRTERARTYQRMTAPRA